MVVEKDRILLRMQQYMVICFVLRINRMKPKYVFIKDFKEIFTKCFSEFLEFLFL